MPRLSNPGSMYPRTPGSISSVPGVVIIPHDIYSPAIKVEVDLINGEGTQNLNDYGSEPYVLHVKVMRRTLNRGLGTATVIIDNRDGIWNQKILGGETIRVYADYASATNQIFVGRIDAPFKNMDSQFGFNMRLECREWPEIQDKAVCMTYENTSGYNCVKNLIDDWFSSYLTYTNLGTMTTNFYRDYSWKSGHLLLRDIFNKSDVLGYIDYDGDVHSFTEQINEVEKIGLESNCASVDSYGADIQSRKNSIILTGDRVESSQNLYFGWSVRDINNINSYWQKDLIYNDSGISSQTAAETDAVLLYNDENQNFIEGSLNAIGGLPTLNPGESIYCSVPLCQIDGYYVIHQYEHTISPSGWMTRVYYTKKLPAYERLFDTRDEEIDGNRLASRNPYAMTSVYVVEFDEIPSIIESFSNTEEYDSYLRLIAGQSTGNAYTQTKEFDENITYAELRVFGEDLGSSYYTISFDNGITWESIELNTKHAVESSSVDLSKLKVRFYLVKDSDNIAPKIYSAWAGVRFD